jgi:hypothetical protein
MRVGESGVPRPFDLNSQGFWFSFVLEGNRFGFFEVTSRKASS